MKHSRLWMPRTGNNSRLQFVLHHARGLAGYEDAGASLILARAAHVLAYGSDDGRQFSKSAVFAAPERADM